MKYKNLQQCTEICARIEKLNSTLSSLERNSDKAVIVSAYYDGASAIIKEWVSTKSENISEHGLYEDIISVFLSHIKTRIQDRIADLTAELEKL